MADPKEQETRDDIGTLDPSVWDEQPAVTGRPNDPVPDNSTFGGRSKAQPGTKAVNGDDAENKSVSSRSTRKKSAE